VLPVTKISVSVLLVTQILQPISARHIEIANICVTSNTNTTVEEICVTNTTIEEICVTGNTDIDACMAQTVP
jgi:hypothetical protein